MRTSSRSCSAALLAVLTLGSIVNAGALGASALMTDALSPRPIAEDIAILQKGRLSARRNALLRLGANRDPAAEEVLLAQFERYGAGELPPALWLDLFEAAAKQGTPKLLAKLEEREKVLAASNDPLSRFSECLEGGDGEAGRKIFMTKPEAGCVRCHSMDGKGGKIGPDLTWLRHSAQRILILESLIFPNATIAMGFQSALIKLKNGKEISGVVSFEGAEELTLTSVVDGKQSKVKTIEIEERTPLPSPMPPHFGTALDKRTIRDLIEFVAMGD